MLPSCPFARLRQRVRFVATAVVTRDDVAFSTSANVASQLSCHLRSSIKVPRHQPACDQILLAPDCDLGQSVKLKIIKTPLLLPPQHRATMMLPKRLALQSVSLRYDTEDNAILLPVWLPKVVKGTPCGSRCCTCRIVAWCPLHLHVLQTMHSVASPIRACIGSIAVLMFGSRQGAQFFMCSFMIAVSAP